MNELKKSIHDNTTGLDYTLVNNHYLPNLTAAAPAEHPTGRWGRLHKTYLKEQHPIWYNQLLLSGELDGYLAKLDKQVARLKLCAVDRPSCPHNLVGAGGTHSIAKRGPVYPVDPSRTVKP